MRNPKGSLWPQQNLPPYAYVKQAYGFSAEIGRRVRHTVTNKEGVIAREDKGAGHYVQVKFDGMNHARPCHPDELAYI